MKVPWVFPVELIHSRTLGPPAEPPYQPLSQKPGGSQDVLGTVFAGHLRNGGRSISNPISLVSETIQVRLK